MEICISIDYLRFAFKSPFLKVITIVSIYRDLLLNFCEELLSENDFEVVLATFCCYDYGALSNPLLQKRRYFSLHQLPTNLFTVKPEHNNRNTCTWTYLKFPNWTKCPVWKTTWFQKQSFYYACTYKTYLKNKTSLWFWTICMRSILRSAKSFWHS